jgi:hypothetical protein
MKSSSRVPVLFQKNQKSAGKLALQKPAIFLQSHLRKRRRAVYALGRLDAAGLASR